MLYLRWFFSPEKKKYKYVVKAVVFSSLINLVFFFVPVLSGLLLTYFYTPDVIDAYNDVKYLQSEVSFGFVQRPDNAETLVPFFLGLVAYFILLFVIKKMKR
ncbi:hypothetical protein [Brevibacillus fortis]|uniref:hypothetical protein n=1 Tax=Brevibacillus fortis TaxID=2126352 RepID=UPI0038FC5F25